jgi:hypothetical protein
MGGSREDLGTFPADARRQAGYQLDKVQRDIEPDDWKPLETIGKGVRELRIRENSSALKLSLEMTNEEEDSERSRTTTCNASWAQRFSRLAFGVRGRRVGNSISFAARAWSLAG